MLVYTILHTIDVTFFMYLGFSFVLEFFWVGNYSVQLDVQDAHCSPFLPQDTHSDFFSSIAYNVLDIQQPVLLSKYKKMGKQRIKMAFGMEMQQVCKMRMVYMRKYAKQLDEYRFAACGKRR